MPTLLLVPSQIRAQDAARIFTNNGTTCRQCHHLVMCLSANSSHEYAGYLFNNMVKSVDHKKQCCKLGWAI
jgi:hypothetical protein